MHQGMRMIVQTLIGSGPEPTPLTPLEVCARGLVVFGFAILIVRLAARRFLSAAAPFDVILGVMLGAILSRIINGPSPLIATMACVALLVVVHRLAGRVSPRYRRLSDFLLGRPAGSAETGDRDAEAMRRNPVPEPNLDRALRFGSAAADLSEASVVTLQRSARINVASRR
jgi:uncharacterized membrane protein YcaP (DUF421 family)